MSEAMDIPTAVAPSNAGFGIAFVTLAVRDLPRASAFYRDVIGLRVLEEGPDAAALGVDGTVLLRLLSRPDARPDDPAGAGLFHIAFLLPSRADLGRWLGRGIRLDGAADHLVSEAAYLHDPEGNGIEIYADRPRAAWRWRDDRVEMANHPLDRPDLLREGAGATWDGAPPGTRVGHVHLRVGDAAQAARFYAARLGLRVTASWPEAAFLSAGGYHHHLAANTWHSAGAGERDPGRAGLVSVTLAGAGLPPGGLRDPWGLHFQPLSTTQELPSP